MGQKMGHFVSEKTRRKISESLMGHKVSEKTKEALVLAHTGKKQSSDTIEKRASQLRGKKRPPFSKTWLRKLSISHKGIPLSEKHKIALSMAKKGKPVPWLIRFGKENSSWRGVKTNYHTIHKWTSKTWGRPQQCANCLTLNAKRYEWANLDKKYDRLKPETWIRLCSSCHIKHDRYGYRLKCELT